MMTVAGNQFATLAPAAGLAMLLGLSACGTGDSAQGFGDEASTAVEGTFDPAGPIAGEGEGRLPGEGDLAIYIPATTLFPGSARIDPGIQNPLSGDPDAVAAGERHYAAFNCGGCHAPLGGGGMGPPLSDDAWIYGSHPAQIYLSIMQGRPDGMPAWSSMLPRRTTWELVAYIETLNDIEDYPAAKGFDSAEIRTARTDEASGGAPAP